MCIEQLVLCRELLSDSIVQAWSSAGAKGPNSEQYYFQLMGELLKIEHQLPVLPNCDIWQRYLIASVIGVDSLLVRSIEMLGAEVLGARMLGAQEKLGAGKMLGENNGDLNKGSLLAAAKHDLACLEQAFTRDLRWLASRQPNAAIFTLPNDGPQNGIQADPVAQWLAATRGWADQCDTFCQLLRTHGGGTLGRFHVLRYVNGTLHGVPHPDPIRLTDLVGYEAQRQVVVDNTARLARGFAAHNLLLYGDRGTGKSATVKAAAAEFAGAGLRLVEIDRHDLHLLPELLEQLRNRPYGVVLFVDDLSFDEGEQSMRHLKVLLEGTVQTVPDNVRLYATSNRRHLVAETTIDRNLEARPGDVIQERLALADRFGRTVVFATPDQDQYLTIVSVLAERAGLNIDQETLHKRALTWTQWENGRSVRTAKQFITELQGEFSQRASSSTL